LLLTAFSVENYRAFSRRQDIDIRPLTLFFGWNSGGKSALVRFLPLLAESIRVAGPPIWLAGDVGRGATWPELVCKATKRPTLRFALRGTVETLQMIEMQGASVVPTIKPSIRSLDEKPLKAEWEIAGDLGGRWQVITALSLNDEPAPMPEEDQWAGLIPPDILQSPTGQELKAALEHLASQVQWISGVRVRPPRIATYGGGASPTLRPDGANAVDHLIAAQLRSTADPLLKATGRFFTSVGEQLVLDNPMEGAWRVLLHPTGAPDVRIDLCDTGEGYAQVLPVLVALARARVGGPRLLCLEQPELHLHTRAQAKLSELLVESARDPASPRILVETHSEVLLMSVQLAIAKGELAPDMVRVYWIESRSDGTSDATPVGFDDKGRPMNTALIGAFDEAIQLGQELVTRQMPERPRPAPHEHLFREFQSPKL
jgi:AAA domain, putative AbiEii toxin, Type IV TA system